MARITQASHLSARRIVGVVLAFIFVVNALESATAATQIVNLGNTWSEYDPKFFGTGIQTISNESASGFTSTINGSVSDFTERPKVYQEFSGVDVSQVGSKLTATYDVQFHTLPDLGDTILRFGFGDRTTNQGLVIMMVDLLQTEGQLSPPGSGEPNSASMRMRYDDSITDDATVFSEGDYSGFLSASNSFTHGKGNPTSPDDSDGPGGIRDTVHIHTFTATAERVERNVDTSFPADGIADEVVEGWYTTLSWTSNEPGAQTAFAEPNTPDGGAVFDAETGLGVWDEGVFSRERIDNLDTLGFVIYTDDPFSNNSSMGSYTISNLVVEYDDGALAADFDDDGDVDDADLTTWQTNYSLSGSATKSLGDTDGDMDVDAMDYLTWQQEFTGAIPPPVAASNAVPEPSAIVLALLAGLAISATNKRRGR